MNKVLFNKDLFNISLPYVSQVDDYKSHKDYITTKRQVFRFTDTGRKYHNSVSNYIPNILTSSDTGPFLKVSSDTLDENYQDQGADVFFADLVDFETKKPLQIFITTDTKLSIIQIFSLNIDFVVDYKKDIKDYYEELNEQLEALCEEIMMENNENLTSESIDLKRNLQSIFDSK
jgi:hypothetical protein